MSTLTTRINGRKITQGQDVYGIPFVAVEARDHSGYEVTRFPQGVDFARTVAFSVMCNLMPETAKDSVNGRVFVRGQVDDDIEVCDCPSGLRSICQYPHI